MKVTQVITAFVVAVMVAAGAWAQSATTPKTEGQKSGQTMMSMEDMTKQCREHCTKASKSMDDMMKMMNDAKQSNDVTKMHTAMAQMQKPMADMKDHMSMCMKMMNMMENMSNMMKKK